MTDKSEQLERLLSEHVDGDLEAERLAELRRALTDEPGAAAAARQYARLGGLLAEWRPLPDGIDWVASAREVRSRITEATGRAVRPRADDPVLEDEAVDRLAREQARPLPDVAWDRLGSRISAAVRREAAAAGPHLGRRPRRLRRAASWVAAVGGPLAAAAAIAFAVWGPTTGGPVGPGGPPSIEPLVLVALEAPEPTGSVSVSFEEVPPRAISDDEASPPGVAIAINPTGVEDREPLDEALFY